MNISDGFYGKRLLHSKSIIAIFLNFVKTEKIKNAFCGRKIVDILFILYYNIKQCVKISVVRLETL